ncbi:hypothetical protein [Nocardia lijiangensis]|uniref:hypothetical protein n=1 Tax=Nocardia lijiangensis TaxID=299618 RepID=UPI003D719714
MAESAFSRRRIVGGAAAGTLGVAPGFSTARAEAAPTHRQRQRRTPPDALAFIGVVGMDAAPRDPEHLRR